MSGKSPGIGERGERFALTALAGSRDRGEADRARAILLTLSGWTSPRIAEAFSVRGRHGSVVAQRFAPRGGIRRVEGERRARSASGKK